MTATLERTVLPDVIDPVFFGHTWQRDADGLFVLPEQTLGWAVACWCDGNPWVFTDEQLRFVLWMYAVDDDGNFLYREIVLQRLKGWGKDPLAAVLCAVELIGPCRAAMNAPPVLDPWGNEHPSGREHPQAWVEVAAVSREQTSNTMSIFPGLFTKQCRQRYRLSIGKTYVTALAGQRRLRAVTSSWRSLEGGRPTFQVQNETQHWRQNNEGHEMAAVMERNATKAADGNTKTFKITNAYEPSEDSVAQQDREAWEDEQDPDVDAVATGVMYDSIEAPPDAIMIKPRDVDEADFVSYLERVVSAVRGDSWWLKPRVIVQAILHRKNPVSRSRRFYFNQIVAAEDAWLDPLAVTAAVHELIDKSTWQDDLLRSGWGLVARDEPCAMFFDGSKSDDETALVGCRLSDLYEFVLGVWHRPAGMKRDEHWQVDRGAVDERIDEVFGRFNIVAFWGDPGGIQDDVDDQQYWIPSFDKWHRKYRDRLQMWATKTGPKAHSVLWDMRSRERNALFTEAAEEFVSAIQNRNAMEVFAPTFRFDGHPRLRRHLTNARRYPNEHGVSLWKGHRESARKVDLAVCAVGARMLARFTLNKGLEETNSGELWGFRSGRTRTPRG
jgi:hypothetical protein